MADCNSGLQVIDISHPANPVLIGGASPPLSTFGVAVAGKHAFLASDEDGLQVFQVYTYDVYSDQNVGQSLAVDGAFDTIVRARLTSMESDGPAWELSANAGANWMPITPDGSWTFNLDPGEELI